MLLPASPGRLLGAAGRRHPTQPLGVPGGPGSGGGSGGRGTLPPPLRGRESTVGGAARRRRASIGRGRVDWALIGPAASPPRPAAVRVFLGAGEGRGADPERSLVSRVSASGARGRGLTVVG